MKDTPSEMRIYNNTPFTVEEIEKMSFIGTTVSLWRQRNVKLYAHPTDETLVVSSGLTFAKDMHVYAVEKRQMWATALEYIAHGRVYVSG